MKKAFAIITALVFSMVLLTGCSLFGLGGKSLSDEIVGEWDGQIDVAKAIYKSLGDELGIELSPEPAYCSVQVIFNEDNTGEFVIDNESFARAVGECVEPYTSGLFSFDTSGLVDIVMQYVAKDMDPGSGTDEFTYEVDDKNDAVTLSTGSDTTTLYRNDDGALEYTDDDELGQTIILEKAE